MPFTTNEHSEYRENFLFQAVTPDHGGVAAKDLNFCGFKTMEHILVIIGYLTGSIPFGLVIGKCLGVDVRSKGSRNIGATNVNRLLGKKAGALTLLCDAGKAVAPMLLASLLLSDHADKGFWVASTGAAAFLGHLYPVYLKFKGGKGVATALGIFFLIKPLAATICVVVFAAVVKIWRYVSLGSLVSSALMPGLIWFMGGDRNYFWLAAFISVLIWVKHHENIGRLLKGQESRLSSEKSG